MSLREGLQREVAASIETLERRLVSSGDTREKRAVAAALIVLSDEQQRLKQPDLLVTLQSLAAARADLERVVGATRFGPFDGYLCALEHHLVRIDRISGRLHAQLALPNAALSWQRTGAPKRPPGHRTRARGVSALKHPIVSTKFADLRAEYERCYSKCSVRPECRATVGYYVRRLRAGQENYELVQSALGIPWGLVGVIHAMECGFNFSCHLHNGDPLTARTSHVPKGRPVGTEPPFTWLQSAVDALQLRKLNEVTDWSVPHLLFLLEGFNGFGYRRHGVPTPYLWSFSNLYSQGKFTQDGKFDPNAVSRQCGAALMLKEVLNA
jgi:lysozyme family protein